MTQHETILAASLETPKKKNLLRNRKVQLGIAFAITAAASAYIARSELFASKEVFMDVAETVANAVTITE